MTNHMSFQEIKTTLHLLEVWSRSKGMGEGEQEKKKDKLSVTHTLCAARAKGKGRELAVLEEVGCKSVLLNGYYVLSKTIVSWSPGLTISHCGKCKDKLVKSQFSGSLPSF